MAKKETLEQKKERLSDLFKEMFLAEQKWNEWEKKFFILEAKHNALKAEIQEIQKHVK